VLTKPPAAEHFACGYQATECASISKTLRFDFTCCFEKTGTEVIVIFFLKRNLLTVQEVTL